MSIACTALTGLSDELLVAEVKSLAGREREATARLVAALAEFDARRLYLGAGCSSLFGYCTRVLRLSEHAAYGRIEAARLAGRFPSILDELVQGSMNLTTVCLIGPLLTEANHQRLIAAARHKSKREVEVLVASEEPKPDVVSCVRKLPMARTGSSATRPESPTQQTVPSPDAPSHRSDLTVPARVADLRPRSRSQTILKPLAPERYRIQLTITAETHEILRQVQNLLRHTNPTGDLAIIVARALSLLLEDLQRTRLAQVSRPRDPQQTASRSRHIPGAVRRAVWKRDRGRCTFIGSEGQCGERGLLEFHHMLPYADGGKATIDNIQLRCAAHNRYEAFLWSPTEATSNGPSQPTR